MRYLSIAIAVSVLMVLTSCTTETSDNGDLDGMWQMTQIDTLSTGGQTDMRNSGIFWSVQKNLLQTSALYNNDLGVFFRFRHNNAQLTISNPYFNNRQEGDIKVEEPEVLQKYGIDGLEQTFDIEQLTSGRMKLKSERFRLHFRKY